MELLLMTEVKRVVKTKLKDEISEELIDLCVEEALDLVKDYCNITEIPQKLKFTIANIAGDIICVDVLSDRYSNEKTIKSINRGDTSITYEANKKIEKDTIIKNYHRELNRHRQLKKV